MFVATTTCHYEEGALPDAHLGRTLRAPGGAGSKILVCSSDGSAE